MGGGGGGEGGGGGKGGGLGFDKVGERESAGVTDDDGIVELDDAISFQGIVDRVGEVKQEADVTGGRRLEIPSKVVVRGGNMEMRR